jgi:N-methylhydantoinase A
MPLFAFGGAGPVHAYRLAEILRLPAVISPLGAGVGSTFGLLAAPLAFDFARSARGRLDELDWTFANTLLGEMADEGRVLLQRSGLAPSELSYQRSAEMRYVGQGHEVSVPLPDGRLGPQHLPVITEHFECVYQTLYGRKGPDVPLEVVNWRVVAGGPPPSVDFRLPMGEAGAGARKGTRKAYIPEETRFIDVPVFDRYALAPGETVRGPAIVEERESTLVVGPRGRARVDGHANVVVEFADA